jgi:hypothetical protein
VTVKSGKINVNRQTRRAIRSIIVYLEAGEPEKACFLMDLLNEMLDTVQAGNPKPWSWFVPRFDEEFSA